MRPVVKRRLDLDAADTLALKGGAAGTKEGDL